MSNPTRPEVQQRLGHLQQRLDSMLQAMDLDPAVLPEPVAVPFNPDHLEALLSGASTQPTPFC